MASCIQCSLKQKKHSMTVYIELSNSKKILNYKYPETKKGADMSVWWLMVSKLDFTSMIFLSVYGTITKSRRYWNIQWTLTS